MTRYLIRATVQIIPGQLTRDNADSHGLLAHNHTVEIVQESGAGVLWAMELAAEQLTEFVIVDGLSVTELPDSAPPAIVPVPIHRQM